MDNPAFAFEQALRNKTKKELLADKLVDMVRNRLLQDGDELPSEREMAQLFSVSRETIRGAVSHLAALGMVSVSHGSKTRVCADESALQHYRLMQGEEVVDASQEARYDIDSVYESRLVIEASIARRAALKIDDHGVAQLEKMLKTQSECDEVYPIPFQMSDKAFHRLISEYADNAILVKYTDELYSFDLNVRRRVLLEPGAVERSYREHIYIVEALKRGDPDAAERAMLAHLDSVYRTTKAKMAGGPG
ncbi:FCD domain-containing protein [Chromohalobacter sp. 296-RDG]|uniref:FadR/GntR family transcriptional regulator n=1 Tax=Chromohalobacter sp. 296-RDG TaxID=2994062 RepID=UPI0024684EDA|nr:FCD domain-containing protein [Chromohalobacter sp. 296-RDG]